MSKGTWVECWHPESDGVRVRVYRPWWRRKKDPFASFREMKRCWIYAMPWSDSWLPWGSPYLDVTQVWESGTLEKKESDHV